MNRLILFPVLFRFLFLCLGVSLVSCNETKPNPSGRPDWIDNPGECVVSSATMHVKGKHYQKELVMSRARVSLAARQGVEVDSITNVEERASNHSAHSQMSRNSQEKITAKEVKAKVVAEWRNPVSRSLWIKMCPE